MASVEELKAITLEGRRIHFRNFEGAPTRFNLEGGVRDFVVFLDPEEAKAMESAGWNVKYLNSRDEDDPPAPILRVKVKYPRTGTKIRPPRVILITSRGKTALDEDTIKVLDWADIENTDMIIRPWKWDIGGKTGISAYLNSIYVTIREDELEQKYMDVPDVHDVGYIPPVDQGQEPF
jgi:hypothetical protein